MVEKFSLKNLSKEEKILLLNELGYGSDGKYVIDKENNRLKDKYVKVEVTLDNMLILPGSTIILDNNAVSISEYMDEYKIEL